MPDTELDAPELRQLLSALPDYVIVVDRRLKIRFVNRVREGLGASDVLGGDAVDFVGPDHREEQRERFRRVFETGERAEYELPVDYEDGVREWYEGTIVPLTREDEVVAVAMVSRNVTARHRAEEEAEALRRLIPVCSWCRKVRSDEGYWQELEEYVGEAEEGEVSHGMCPDCREEFLEQDVSRSA